MSKNRSIALLYDCPYPFVQGGGQKRLFEIATRLTQKGWKIHWYALKFWEGADVIEHAGIRYISVGKPVPLYRKNGKRSLKEALYYGYCFLFKFSLREYSLIHAGQWPYFHLYPARFYTLFGNGKLVVDWWETWGVHWKEYAKKMSLIGRLLEWCSAKLPARLIAISQQGKRDLSSLGLQAEKVTVIHNGIDFAQFQMITGETKAFDFVYMGRLAPHKNVSHLVAAMGHLRHAGVLASLEIIGDGPERERLESQVACLNLTENIKFHGTIPDSKKAFAKVKAARYFVHPSTKEGGGSITALEANACGLPVVAYRHPNGIAAELIQEGVNGYWVDIVDPVALAEKLATLLQQTSLQKELILSGVKQYDWDNIAEEYHQYLVAI